MDDENKPEARGGGKPYLEIKFFFRLTAGEERPESFFIDEIRKRLIAPPAGTVGVPFAYTFDLTIDGVEIGDELFTDAAGWQLRRQGNIFHLTGTPTQEFNGRLIFTYQHRQAGAEYIPQPIITPVPFTIAHPRDLWQNLPVADYDGYENPDADARGGEIFAPEAPRRLEIIAASTRGRSHAHIAKPRDDYFQFFVNPATGWNFVAVADGAGSAKYSRQGARLACDAALQSLDRNLSAEFTEKFRRDGREWRDEFMRGDLAAEPSFIEKTQWGAVFHRAVYDAHEAIRAEADRRKTERGDGATLKDYHTTLLCAALRYFPEWAAWFIASYWVGDGGAAILRWNDSDRVLVLGEPDGGEFAGQTRFLTMKDEIAAEPIRRRLRFSFCDAFAALLLVTDGITDPFFPSEAAVGDAARWLEFYEQKLRAGCEEEPRGCPEIFAADKSPQEKADALLRWLNFWSKGNHDDRTVLVVREV
ncbi:MAG: protein phosphatase 2C domain-containing protein [Planctomycetota bacterium]|jgi:serine/threonine protein phosphatase PrpC|nr:protein phosphatase 2C domain-containing protein [Planctomycetota bacterium]